MARAPRLLLSLLLCASPWVLSPLLLGCKTGPQLTKIEAPAEGIALRYDLTPGQVYKGSVRHNETIRSSNTSNSSSNHFSFDLTLVVRGPDQEHGGTHVTARFSAVTVRWTPPPGLPVSVAELNKNASKQLQGLEAVQALKAAHPNLDLNALRMVVYAAVLIALMILRPEGLFRRA